ncbi:thioredoxin family protein [Reichenbachiella sp. MALMAid0571]|uniref:thioredoxin family protein n=1 Tax=Reichenbachiella sp. MALMAid0571 TaxID=3143939 RepID=UPI0032DF16D8
MKKNILISTGVLSVVLIFFVNAKKTSILENSEKYEVGDYARDFNLKSTDGTMVSMAGMKEAKGFIIIFTCNTCPFSKMYEERIKELHTEYSTKGFPVIAINPNDQDLSPEDSFESMKARAKAQKFNFPYLQDETQEIVTSYGASRTPQVFVLLKEKDKYKVAYEGAIDNNHRDASMASKKYVKEAVDNLLLGKEVQTKFTKAIGCSIKWKES